jgi:lactate dehydrogenase-like 2-hydroxyacid dehydrogenase
LTPKGFDESSLLDLVSEADIFLGSYITNKMLDKAVRLKFIQIPWTGVDNLDFELLSKHNIVVCNSHSNSAAVAEHAVAMMMDAAKKISYHDRLLRQGKWNRVIRGQINEISPFSKMISKSRVGIIGFGAIGKQIYSFLKGYNCTFKIFTKGVVNQDVYGTDLIAFSPLDMYNEISELDFIFVTVPLTPETNKMINSQFLSAMNNSAILINISRGEVIHEEDFYNALKDKTIAFASVDTWFNYPTKENTEVFPSSRFDYHLLDNLVLSPHRAGYVENCFPHLDDAIENINRAYQGKPLKNVISLKDRY